MQTTWTTKNNSFEITATRPDRLVRLVKIELVVNGKQTRNAHINGDKVNFEIGGQKAACALPAEIAAEIEALRTADTRTAEEKHHDEMSLANEEAYQASVRRIENAMNM